MNWLLVFSNALWILGLALLLTALTLADWEAHLQKQPVRQNLSTPFFRLAIVAGFTLFALGLLLLVDPWPHKAAWLMVLALAAWQGLTAWRDRSGQHG